MTSLENNCRTERRKKSSLSSVSYLCYLLCATDAFKRLSHRDDRTEMIFKNREFDYDCQVALKLLFGQFSLSVIKSDI